MNTTAVAPRFDAVEKHPDDALTGYSYFAADEAAMKEMVDDLFVHNWQRIVIGPCIERAVFEIIFKEPPGVRISDGYLTVDLGAWHFHLCIGAHKGGEKGKTKAVLAHPMADPAIAYQGDCGGILDSNVLDRVFGVRAERLESAGGHSVYVFDRVPEAQ